MVHESGHIMLTDFDLSTIQSSSPLNVSLVLKEKNYGFELKSIQKTQDPTTSRNCLFNCRSQYQYPFRSKM